MTLWHRSGTAVRILAAFSLVLTYAGSLAAQNSRRTIRGVVRSLAGPVAGANVFVLETLDGVLTDSSGSFTIQASPHDIVRLEADDDYVREFTRELSYLVYLTLNDFERRLDAERFMRIHRAHMVNIDFVSQLVPLEGGRMQVELRDGSMIAASRARSRALRERTL